MGAESIKAKLKTISKKTGKGYMELFKQLTFERFLARVSSSEYKENLIFKGGLCLKEYIVSGRETMDIDFLVKKINNEVSTIESVFRTIAEINLQDDYEFKEVKASKLDIEHKQYPGIRVKLTAKLGNMKDRLQIDIGFGDVVEERMIELTQTEYKGKSLIDSESVEVMAYPPEYIFSEKLQAIIELGEFNSRMKDYFDCWVLVSSDILSPQKTREAITKTFDKRETAIQLIGDYPKELEMLWSQFKKKVKTAPPSIQDTVDKINEHIKKHVVSVQVPK